MADAAVVELVDAPDSKRGWCWYRGFISSALNTGTSCGIGRGSQTGLKCARSHIGAKRLDAGVVELVDAPDSKSGSARSVGSTPTTRTNYSNGMAALTLWGARTSFVASGRQAFWRTRHGELT